MVWICEHTKGMIIAGTVMLHAVWAYVLLLHMLALLQCASRSPFIDLDGMRVVLRKISSCLVSSHVAHRK